MSPLYNFILSQWILGKDSVYVNNAVTKSYITQIEANTILSTPKAG